MKHQFWIFLSSSLVLARAFLLQPSPRTKDSCDLPSTALHVVSSHGDDDCSSRRSFLTKASIVSSAVLTGTFLGSQTDALAANSQIGATYAGPRNKRIGGLVSKIRNVGTVMDELQRDLMQERWDLVQAFPAQLRSYVPIFTTYTDSAFPTDIPTDNGLRVALRYEVGRFCK